MNIYNLKLHNTTAPAIKPLTTMEHLAKLRSDVPIFVTTYRYSSSRYKLMTTMRRYPDVEKKADALNRTLLHVAASQGKNKVIEWLHDRGKSNSTNFYLFFFGLDFTTSTKS